MFKPSFWGWVATATLLGACTGELGGLAGDARLDTEPDIVAELSASDGWRSIEASEPAFDTVRFDVMARPEVADIDALVALGADEITDFSDASIKVRFADDGFVDARDGSTYRSDNAVRYRPGVWYRITISANVEAQTYDVAVGGDGEPPETLITGAAFDSQASITDRLATWAAWSSQSARLDIARHSWVASGSCAPSTCLSLGVVCGEPSDGCSGNLTCGSCGSGQTCNSGVCEDVPPPPSPEPPPPPSCEPATCVSLGMECGDWDDGCSGQLSCGGCGSGQTCTSGVCVDVMPPSPPPCAPATCTSWGVECGRWSDGCGGELWCGGCGSGRSCTSGMCVDVQPPPPPPCQPATCLSLGKECGSSNDGCGGTLSCGSCAGGEVCSTEGICYDPSPPPPPTGNVIFADDFDGDLSNWDEQGGEANKYRITADSALVHTGSGALDITIRSDWSGGQLNKWFTAVDELHVTFDIMFSADWDQSGVNSRHLMQLSGNNVNIMRWGPNPDSSFGRAGETPDGTDFFWIHLTPWNDDAWHVGMAHPAQSSIWGDSIQSDIYTAPGSYQHVVLHGRLNDLGSSNGFIRLTVDGATAIDRSDMQWRTSDELVFNSIGFQAYYTDFPGTGHVYVDNLVIREGAP